MAFTSVDLPAPAANGSGAAVDCSALGPTRTITVSSDQAFVIVEVSNQDSPTKWAPLASFLASGEQTGVCAAKWMRATVTNYESGDAPTVSVGAEEATSAVYTELETTAGSGTGAAVDISTMPPFKTVQVAGIWSGCVSIEVSVDGGVSYEEAFSFQSQQSGIQSRVVQADFVRVTRSGVSSKHPGRPIVSIGGAMVDSSGDALPVALLRTAAAMSRIQMQLTLGNAQVSLGEGIPFSQVGNILSGAGPHNNIAPDINLGDPNTFMAPYAPLVFNSNDDGTLTGLVSVDITTNGWTTACAAPPGYGDGACIIQNISPVANLTLVNQSNSSTEPRRFALPGSANVVIPPLSAVLCLYETASQRWHIWTPTYP